jgi:hypothetical protein
LNACSCRRVVCWLIVFLSLTTLDQGIAHITCCGCFCCFCFCYCLCCRPYFHRSPCIPPAAPAVSSCRICSTVALWQQQQQQWRQHCS